MARTCECAECGRPILLGDEYWISHVSGELMFCSEGCMRSWIKDDDIIDKVVYDWIEDNAELCTLESDDPYDRYGVHESDFI